MFRVSHLTFAVSHKIRLNPLDQLNPRSMPFFLLINHIRQQLDQFLPIKTLDNIGIILFHHFVH